MNKTMDAVATSASPQGGDPLYAKRMNGEKEHFSHQYRGHGPDDILILRVPPVWTFLEQRVEKIIRADTGGLFLQDYIAGIMNSRSSPRMISLASGPCGLELDIAGRLQGDYVIECLDINQELLARGMEQAIHKGLHLSARVADCNHCEISEGAYDVVMAFASLHHFVNLEEILPRIARALRPGGVFVTMDISSRNGYRMWDEAWADVKAIWSLLPDRLKVNHTRFQHPALVPDYENVDYGDSSFECVRSQDILSQLERHFDPVHYVSYYALCRRFFDPMYGPNYDLDRPLDRAIVELVWELDRAALADARLPPETFFGVFQPRGHVVGSRLDERKARLSSDIRAIERMVLSAESRKIKGVPQHKDTTTWYQKTRERLSCVFARGGKDG
ncbi:MAG: class I SAM-dependent methyltransferase [bacterium]